MKRLASAVLTFVVAVATVSTGGTAVAETTTNPTPGRYPSPGSDALLYVTPGLWTVNGRDWQTTCQMYSSTVERCRTSIWSSRILWIGNQFVPTTGWSFNNLTYKPAPPSTWGANPLANQAQWTDYDGAPWRTECDTAITGPNACRSYRQGTVVKSAINASGFRVYSLERQWVLNNIVRFTASTASATSTASSTLTPSPVGTTTPTVAPSPLGSITTSPTPTSGAYPSATPYAQPGELPAFITDALLAPCSGADRIPSGYRLAGPEQLPYSARAFYADATSFNAVAVASFNTDVALSTTLSDDEKACWAKKSAAQLLWYSTTTTSPDGRTARFFHYQFEFRANPSSEVMPVGWISGLGASGAINAFVSTADLTGDPAWDQFADEAYESYFVPIEDGGFTSLEPGVLWFEEYPGDPSTTVLNGMDYATLSFVRHARAINDERGLALIPDIIDAYRTLLPLFDISDGSGQVATYDLVRGMKTESPLRVVRISGDGAVTQATVHGQTLAPSVVDALSPAPELITNGGFNGTAGWKLIGTDASISDGRATYAPTDGAWQGISQEIPATQFTEKGRALSLSYRIRRTETPEGGQVSAKVSMFQRCNGVLSNLYITEAPRGTAWGTFNAKIPAPSEGCSVMVQFLPQFQLADGSSFEVDDVSLRYADSVNLQAFTPQYDHFVWRSPTTEVTLYGSGVVELQVYDGGRWRPLGRSSLDPVAGVEMVVPERYTGRNINYGYQNHHPVEMWYLYQSLGDPVFLEYAKRWDPTALGWTVPSA